MTYFRNWGALHWTIALLGFVSAAVLSILLITTPLAQWSSLPTTAFGAVVASCIAALAALAVSETVDQRRRAEVQGALRTHRERVYEQLLLYLTRIFVGGSPVDDLAMVRTTVAVWGSARVVRELTDWNVMVRPIIERGPGSVDLYPSEKEALLKKMGEIAIAVRADLTESGGPAGTPTADQITSMMFDDYKPTVDELAKDLPR